MARPFWVFDLDGTLVDSHAIYFESLAAVLEAQGSKLEDTDRREILTIAVKDRDSFFVRKLGASGARQAIRQFDRRLADDQISVRPFAGIPELLEELHAKGAQLALWTAREMDSAVEVLSHTGLKKYFSFRMSGSCVTNCKPDPEGLLRIARHFITKPSKVVMVGDHDNDMLAARACGARGVRALWNNPETAAACTLSEWQFKNVPDFHAWAAE
jgi:phosphoglycolate phosphatase